MSNGEPREPSRAPGRDDGDAPTAAPAPAAAIGGGASDFQSVASPPAAADGEWDRPSPPPPSSTVSVRRRGRPPGTNRPPLSDPEPSHEAQRAAGLCRDAMAKLKGCVTTLERNPTTAPLAGEKRFRRNGACSCDDADAICETESPSQPMPIPAPSRPAMRVCRGNGWINEEQAQSLPPEYRSKK